MGDRVRAKALEISERRLLKLGWKFSMEDVGEGAATIIKALDSALKPAPTQEN